MTQHGRSHWIKLYVEMLDDPKVGLLPDAVKWRWVSVLLLAGELNEDGFLPDVNDMAWRLHTNVETLQGEMRTMAGRGLVELRAYPTGEERWFIPAFVSRQAAASSTDRSRMHRHRARQHSAETPLQRNVANSSHNTEYRIQNTETKTGGEKSGVAAPAPPRGASPQLDPVPEEGGKAKARRGDREPQPAIVAQAPAAVRLIAQLTNSWPGEHLTADLVQLFGETPNEAALTEAVRQWRLANHKLTNYGGIGEWYQELCRDPTWTPGKRFKSNGYKNFRNDPDARESHNRAVLDEVAKEIQSGEWSPW